LDKNGCKLVPLTSSIAPFDLNEAVFHTTCLWSDLEHEIPLAIQVGQARRNLVCVVDNRILMAPDNGLIGLIAGKNNWSTPLYFSSRESVLNMMDALVERGFDDLKKNMLKPCPVPVERVAARAVFTNGMVIAPYVCSDRFGNAFFDLSLADFNEFSGESKYRIRIPRVMDFFNLSNYYSDVPPGEALARFYNEHYLQIAINLGNASQLMSAKSNNQLYIEKL
jgi:S-adenosylmethionine hydrolase